MARDIATNKRPPGERVKLADRAYASIREMIVSGKVGMGEHLVETQLSDSLGISRAPVREALRRLAAEGLVDDTAHHGAYVATLTAQDVADLYNVRLGLETVGLRLFMARKASTGPLSASLERMRGAAAAGDMDRLVRAELEFHRRIAEGSGNALVRRLFAELEGRVMLALALDDALYDHLDDVALEHVPTLDAIESGDAEAAAQILQGHIVSTVGGLLKSMGGTELRVLGRDRP